MTDYSTDPIFAHHLDEIDPLKKLRDKFFLPKGHYFAGNSLGAQPKNCATFIQEELEKWADFGSLAHNLADIGWMYYQEQLSSDLASIAGALPTEVIAMNSLTVNLHLMLVSFYKPTKERYKILVNPLLFPSDRYALQTQVKYHHLDPNDVTLEIPADQNGIVSQNDLEDILEKEGDSIALVLMEGVNFMTGQAFNFKKIASLAHQKGALIGFDLAHVIGNLELALHEWEIDFAVWCSYKYLNAGPGSVGGCFVHEKHHNDENLQRYGGWFGHDKNDRFSTKAQFRPIPTIEGWQISNPPILSLAALKASLQIFKEAGMEQLRKKSLHLTGYLEFLLRQINIKIVTPPERGCQLSLIGTKELCTQFINNGFICDFRSPHIIRIAPVPLYNTYEDVFQLYNYLKEAKI